MSHIRRLGRDLGQRFPHKLLLAIILSAVAGMAFTRAFIGSVSVVDGISMAPTFQPGARVYTVPITAPLERGEIVVVDDGKKDYAMKRIVGMPGETVQFWRGRVFINKQLLSEPYLPKHTYTYPLGEWVEFHLGDCQYFVLGDNRPCSADSRTYGPLARDQIKRRILSAGELRAEFRPYTLPAMGKMLIRPM